MTFYIKPKSLLYKLVKTWFMDNGWDLSWKAIEEGREPLGLFDIIFSVLYVFWPKWRLK